MEGGGNKMHCTVIRQVIERQCFLLCNLCREALPEPLPNVPLVLAACAEFWCV